VSQPTAPDGRGWPTPADTRSFAPGDDDRTGWPGGNDGWGPSTAVRAGTGQFGSARGSGGARDGEGSGRRAWSGFSNTDPAQDAPYGTDPDGGPGSWTPGGPRSSREQRATRAEQRRTARSVEALTDPRVRERGMPWWAALVLLIVIAAVGGIIDSVGSSQVNGGFNVGIVVASLVAILAVKRSHMFPIVIAPPIVYSGAAVFQLYVRSSGLSDRKVVLDAAANYLVYGFPAIAAATAAVLIIAGIRLIARK
jgi:hypothetical protein